MNIIYSFLITISYLLVIIFGIKFANKNECFCDHLSLENTNSIRGISAIGILFTHASFHFDNLYFQIPFKFSGYLFVGIFLFYSAYGLIFSYENKKDYLKGFFRNRLAALLIPLYITIIIFKILLTVVGKKEFEISSILLAFYENWFVFSLIYSYIIFYFIFKIKKITLKTKICTFSVVFLIITTALCLITKSTIYALSSLSFVLGLSWYIFKEKLTFTSIKKFLVAIVTASFLFVAFLGAKFVGDIKSISSLETIGSIFSSLAFTFVIILLTQRIRIKNIITKFLGSISYEIYLVHGFMIDLLLLNNTIKSNMLLFYGLVIVSTIAISYILNNIDTKIVKLIKK